VEVRRGWERKRDRIFNQKRSVEKRRKKGGVKGEDKRKGVEL